MEEKDGDDWSREYIEKKIVGKMTAVAIPIDIRIEGKNRVLDLSEAEELMRNAEAISLQECYCRTEMKKCVEPMDGCISLNKEAREMIDKGDGWEATIDEALEALRKTHEAGLVHMAYQMDDEDSPSIICSCCSCCCHTLTAAVRFGFPDHAFTSKMIAVQDHDACIDCGACVPRCQFEAREMVEGKLVYNDDKCYGCGVCISTCPTEAIKMVDREA